MSTVAVSLVAFAVVKCMLHVSAFGIGFVAATAWSKRAAAMRADEDHASQRATVAAATAAETACRNLCHIAERMAGEVRTHAEVVGAVSKELTPVCQSQGEHGQPLKEAAVKTVAANMKLQRRLEDAQRKIRLHIGELSTTRR